MKLEKRIEKILLDYVGVESITNTRKELYVNDFWEKTIGELDYFRKNPDNFGNEVIPKDIYGRSVNWAFYNANVKNTVVLIHHSDVVGIDNYFDMKDIALQPYKLEEELKKNINMLEDEAKEDLLSGDWLFGRGVCDMKGGGAIQIALLEKLSKDKYPLNIILLAVPDEENYSAGMRHSSKILDKLKKEYQLDYKLMIDSEPHQRLVKERGVLSQGTIAKMNLFVYVKGILTHAGKANEGINAIGLMSRIAAKFEMNTKFCDIENGEMSIAPTWMYLRDLKEHYDVSTPDEAIGYLNLLNFTKNPKEIIEIMKKDIEKESNELTSELYLSYLEFMKKSRRERYIKPFNTKVFTFDELKNTVIKDEKDRKEYEIYRDSVAKSVNNGEIKAFDGTTNIVRYLIKKYNGVELISVIGLAPPYYPSVSNIYMDDVPDYKKIVNDFTKTKLNQEYDNEYFFTGICDLSFASVKEIPDMSDMPLWDKTFSIPFEELKRVSMPVLNIGPWGKDFHRNSERVYKEDLYKNTPMIIKNVLDNLID